MQKNDDFEPGVLPVEAPGLFGLAARPSRQEMKRTHSAAVGLFLSASQKSLGRRGLEFKVFSERRIQIALTLQPFACFCSASQRKLGPRSPR